MLSFLGRGFQRTDAPAPPIKVRPVSSNGLGGTDLKTGALEAVKKTLIGRAISESCRPTTRLWFGAASGFEG